MQSSAVVSEFVSPLTSGGMEFFDQFDHTIDSKGRLVLPSAYRDAFVGGGFLTFLPPYAALFTPSGWDKYKRKLELSKVLSREDFRVLSSLVTPFEPDKQNRVVLPAKLRSRAGLEREVTVVGSISHAAIYPREEWAAIEASAFGPDESGETLRDKLAKLDFL